MAHVFAWALTWTLMEALTRIYEVLWTDEFVSGLTLAVGQACGQGVFVGAGSSLEVSPLACSLRFECLT